jgi:DNA polymerase-3 subunit epsilon
MYLFFDTETTGTPKDYNASPKNYDMFPRMVQLGFVLYDKERNLIKEGNYIIKPDGYEIPEGASNIHGITTEMAIKSGVDISIALNDFFDCLDISEYVICHNLKFDENVLLSEYFRYGMKRVSTKKTKICTMLETVEYCKIPQTWNPKKFKWAKLIELHNILFGEDFEGAHDAFSDVKATARCFWELIDNKIIDLDKKIISQ